jgi:phytoene dehydrogenase-like protein
MKKAIIIGSGISGLTAAAYLARDDWQVSVYEQFSEIGGVTATLHQDGFSWDMGPMLLEGFSPNEPAGMILADLGVTENIGLIRDERGIEFPDFSLWKPDKYSGKYWRQSRLKELFPKESRGLDRYYALYDRVMTLVSWQRKLWRCKGVFTQLWVKLNLALAFQAVRGMKDWNAAQLMDEFFQDEKLKAVFTTLLADFVTPPSHFPALAVPAINVETPFDRDMPTFGQPTYHYVRGGMINLVNALAGVVTENGGTILINNCVQKILVKDGMVEGVKLQDGTFEACDLVIASGGVNETMFGLVGEENLTQEFIHKVRDVPLMESVHMVHLGINFDPQPHQRRALCYYYTTYDTEGAIKACREGVYEGGEHGFLIYIPSLHSPAMAPAGCHAVTIYTIAPNHLQRGSWAERREELTGILLDRAELKIPGLRNGTITRMIFTPDDFRQRVHLEHDAFGGRAPFKGRKGGPLKTPIQGLWFIGRQSDKVGGGVWGTMMSAYEVIRQISHNGEENQ